jgi:hypothetical protein
MGSTERGVCLEHSGLCVGVDSVRKDVDYINEVEIPAINKSISELKIFIAKTTGVAMGVMIVLEKTGFLK